MRHSDAMLELLFPHTTEPRPFEQLRLSEMIEAALADLELVEQSDNYVVDMDFWHEPSGNGEPCAVCFAGSVMAKHFNLRRSKSIDDHGGPFDASVWSAFLALNSVRQGDVFAALQSLKCDTAGVPDLSFKVTEYDCNPELFKLEMRDLAERLREYDL